jgi:SAM-dependent methyltransferase
VSDQQAGTRGLGAGALPEIDPTRPSIARVHDFILGGKQNFAIDRRVGNAVLAVEPEAQQLAEGGRTTLLRMVRWLVEEAGITQIVDLGSGLPAEHNVHEVAHEVDPATRVVYVDSDPMVLVHGRALLQTDENVAVIQADVRNVEQIFDHPDLTALVDTDKPFAVITANVLQYLEDDEANATAEALRARLTPGSYFVSCNVLDDDEQRAEDLQRVLREGLGTGRFRTWDELQQFFEGLEMVEPGLTYSHDWRPDRKTPRASPVHTLHAAGIGRMPG